MLASIREMAVQRHGRQHRYQIRAMRLHPGDVILEIDGKVVRAPAEFAAMVRGAAGELDLEVQRRGMRIHVPHGTVRR